MPTFEVEEVNGQLVLLPTDGSGARKNPFAKDRREVRNEGQWYFWIAQIMSVIQGVPCG